MINTLPSPITTKPRIQVGRGIGSGKGGHTSGRGTKGQGSRSGFTRPRPNFEGGQNPFSRRFPKLKGFSRGEFTKGVKRISLHLSQVAEAVTGDVIDFDTLLDAGLIGNPSKKLDVKILFDQKVERKLQIKGVAVSATVKAAVEEAGGSVE